MKKLDNFANCLHILADADFKMAETDDIYRTGIVGQYNLTFEIGIKKGRLLQLIKQVCAKMQKFSSAEEIANDLVEQDVPLIQKIMDVAPNFGPDYNVDAIYKALNL